MGIRVTKRGRNRTENELDTMKATAAALIVSCLALAEVASGQVHYLSKLTTLVGRPGFDPPLGSGASEPNDPVDIQVCGNGPKACCVASDINNDMFDLTVDHEDVFEGEDLGECEGFELGNLSYGDDVAITIACEFEYEGDGPFIIANSDTCYFDY